VIRVGPAGWSYADWEGRIHPRGGTRGPDDLDRLLDVFACVELNVSFYRDPGSKAQESWLQRLARHPDARLPVKLHQRFTHESALLARGELDRAMGAWRAGLAPLLGSAQCGPVLVQFPFSFQPNAAREEYLVRLLDALVDLRPVVELRRRGWFEPEPRARLLAHGARLAALDMPEHPDHPDLQTAAAGPVGYVRLHGRNRSAWFDRSAGRDQRYNHLYSRAELAPIARLAREVSARTAETYVIVNNHFEGKAVANGVDLMVLLEQPPACIPARWADAFVHLRRAAPLHGQQGLF